MAVSMPGHCDLTTLMSRMALSLTLWVLTVCIHAEVERFFRGRMANFCPTRVVCKKNRENISELRFLTNKQMKTGFSAVVFGVA